MYSMHFAEVKNLFLCVTDHQRLTVRELFMDRDSEEEPDASDDDSDSSFCQKKKIVILMAAMLTDLRVCIY